MALENETLQGPDVLNGSLAGPDIGDVSLTNPDLGPDSVGNAQMADNAVGSPEVSPDSLGATDLGSSSVGSSEMADNAIGSAEVSANSLRLADLSMGITDESSANLAGTVNAGSCSSFFGDALEFGSAPIGSHTLVYHVRLASGGEPRMDRGRDDDDHVERRPAAVLQQHGRERGPTEPHLQLHDDPAMRRA